MPSSLLHEHIMKAPLNQILDAVTTSVLSTQEELNRQSLAIAARLAGAAPEDQITFGTSKYSLLELGFVPEFYQLGETEIKLKMAMQLQNDNGQLQIHGSLLNERNMCGFGFDALGASEITARLVPNSSAPVFEKRIGQMMTELQQAAFEVIREYVIAQDASPMTQYELQQVGIDELIEANLGDYRARLIALHPDEMPHIPALQQLIERVNGFVKVLSYVLVNDTRPMTIDEVYETGVLGALERNLLHYRDRLMHISNLSDVDSLQIIVDQANSFAQILGLLQVSQVTALTIEQFTVGGVLRLDENNWSLYLAQLELLSLETLKTYTFSDLQLLIDTVNP
jgi:hypothetical protein